MSKSTYKIIGKRNPKIVITSSNNEEFVIQTIGDPHLGRHWRNNQKHRLGDREENVKETFVKLLNEPSDVTVIMGDLLDKVVITNEWFSFILATLKKACNNNPNKQYVILNGNHDEVKDKSRISSFSLIEDYFKNLNTILNLTFVSSCNVNFFINSVNTSLIFTNYNPFKSSKNSFDDIKTDSNNVLKIAFGHYDIDHYDFIDNSKFIDHSIPDFIKNNYDLVVNGHFHKPTTIIDPIPIVVTGSMQPYAFGEEIPEDDKYYVTLNIDEIKSILDKDSEAFINSNVRIMYNKGDDLLSPFNCYSITYKLIQQLPFEKEQVVITESISFSDMFLTSLNSYSNSENQQYIDKITKVFLDKNYEGN